MTKRDKILLTVFAVAGAGLLAYYLFAGKKSKQSRTTYEEFEQAAADAKWNWARPIHHVAREELIMKWTTNLNMADQNRALEIAKEWKTATDEQKKALSAEGKNIFVKLVNG